LNSNTKRIRRQILNNILATESEYNQLTKTIVPHVPQIDTRRFMKLYANRVHSHYNFMTILPTPVPYLEKGRATLSKSSVILWQFRKCPTKDVEQISLKEFTNDKFYTNGFICLWQRISHQTFEQASKKVQAANSSTTTRSFQTSCKPARSASDHSHAQPLNSLQVLSYWCSPGGGNQLALSS